MYPADLFNSPSIGLGYQLGAAAAAAAASPWRQLYMPPSPAAERGYRHSPVQSTITPHHLLHHHHPQPLWSPTSAFTHPAAAAAGFAEGATVQHWADHILQ